MSFISKNKTYIKLGLVSGLIFALLMLAFDYFMGKPFLVWKFILHFILFGAFNGFMAYRRVKKEKKRRNKS
ncbi:hypothetical protein [Corallibacter sp.]|uniref:hypothetical protein n=1 Tax=Corallibacter sp. TaxID=2038084 RepID=UPI003AB704E4